MDLGNHIRDLGRSHATLLDSSSGVEHTRKEFIIPTKRDLKSKLLANTAPNSEDGDELCIYFCGNSLGLQPRRTSGLITQHLVAWGKKGVLGHFKEHDDSSLPPFLHVDDAAAKLMAPIVGANHEEVAVMETLTANLHFLMASLYRPTATHHKIIIEGKAFPSDHYAVESQIRHHGFNPQESMVIIDPGDSRSATMTTSHIISVIEEHALSTALILLPGIQYYTGQFLDIERITAKAHTLGILIGWDLAHAVGNVVLELDRWDVDFAAWCNYKYINSGPGAIGGLFVNSKHGKVELTAKGERSFRLRLSGWWGGDRAIRFGMGQEFAPIPGAAGFQVGNPSALAITAVIASLQIFAMSSMTVLRAKSVALTGYLEELLLRPPLPHGLDEGDLPYTIVTPSNAAERGAQLSVRLRPGLLDKVMEGLESAGSIVDERKPDVVRIAPTPLYNTFEEIWDFVVIFAAACSEAQRFEIKGDQEAAMLQGQNEKGWATVQ